MMKRIIASACALIVLVMALAGCGAKKQDWEYIADKGEMVVGITEFEPMNYKGADGEYTGFETEFAQAVCKKLGLKAKFIVIDWEAKETELKTKNIDCIWNGMTITDERKANMGISVPYMRNRQVMIVKKENVDKFKASVNGAKIVAESKSAGEELATTNDFFKSAQFTAVVDQKTALMEVKSGTADICLIDYVMATATVGEGTSYEDLTFIADKEFSPEEYGIAFRKEDTETLAKFNQAIQDIANDGTLETIAKKYNLADLLLVKAK